MNCLVWSYTLYTRYKSNKRWELTLFYFQIVWNKILLVFYLTCTIWVSKTGQYFGLYCIGSCTNLGAYSYSFWRTTSAHRVAALFLDHFMSLQKIMISPTIRFIYFFTYFFSRNFISRFVFTCFIFSILQKKIIQEIIQKQYGYGVVAFEWQDISFSCLNRSNIEQTTRLRKARALLWSYLSCKVLERMKEEKNTYFWKNIFIFLSSPY